MPSLLHNMSGSLTLRVIFHSLGVPSHIMWQSHDPHRTCLWRICYAPFVLLHLVGLERRGVTVLHFKIAQTLGCDKCYPVCVHGQYIYANTDTFALCAGGPWSWPLQGREPPSHCCHCIPPTLWCLCQSCRQAVSTVLLGQQCKCTAHVCVS